MDFERVVGVDFSAARRDAGRKTWIAEGTVANGTFELDCLEDAASHLDCKPSRDETHEALVEHIRGFDDRTVVGLDFPFSLPAGLVDGKWCEFVEGTADNGEKWGVLGEIDTPRELYDKAKSHADENGHDLRRKTDRATGGQEPTGFRIKTQTYYGISSVLGGIHDEVAVAPFDDPAGGDIVVTEAYPAALLDELDANRTGYKRDTRAGIEARQENVEVLQEQSVTFGDDREFAVATDDALDAVTAAVAAWWAAENGFETAGHDDESVEGYIYADGPR